MRKIVVLFICLLSVPYLQAQNDEGTSSPAKERVQDVPLPDFFPPEDLTGPPFRPEEYLRPPGPETDKFLAEFVKMAATLGMIIGLILLVAWFLKRMVNTRLEQANEASAIRVVERRAISPKTTIYLLELENKGIIVAESQSGVTYLGDYDANVLAEDSTQKLPSAFNRLLSKRGDTKE